MQQSLPYQVSHDIVQTVPSPAAPCGMSILVRFVCVCMCVCVSVCVCVCVSVCVCVCVCVWMYAFFILGPSVWCMDVWCTCVDEKLVTKGYSAFPLRMC